MQTSLHRPARIDSPLLQFRKNVTSQCGEDGIIAPAVSDDDSKEKFPNGFRKVKDYLRFTPQPNK